MTGSVEWMAGEAGRMCMGGRVATKAVRLQSTLYMNSLLPILLLTVPVTPVP